MAKQFTIDELKRYFFGNVRHVAYKDTVDLYNKMNTHANGEVPTKLINERRPRESEEIKEYRKKIYVPKTKSPITKVLNSLAKIRRSPDWQIKWTDAFKPAAAGENTLEEYCEKDYPGYESITNWIFSVVLKNMCIDPNCVVAVFPRKTEIASNEFYEPMAMVINSPNVVWFQEGSDFAILESEEKKTVVLDAAAQTYFYGRIFFVFTEEKFYKYEQITSANDYTLTAEITHNFGKLPVFKIPAVFLKNLDNTTIQESRISPMVTDLDEAAREYSDLQASKVQHMHPWMWYYSNKACTHCDGMGKVPNQTNPTEGPKKCTVCNGSGKVNFSPYSHIEVEPPKLGEQNTPTPPAGYVQRDVEAMKFQSDSVKENLYSALSSINMQFLDQTPLNISGEAKQTDREELNNFVYSVAEDIVRCMDKTIFWINEWRYSFLVPDTAKRKTMLPKITVPQNFDLLPAGYLMDEITKASSAKNVSPILLQSLQKEYSTKKFYNDPDVAQFIGALFDLDPLPGISEDEKMTRVSNKGVTQEDYVISCNLVAFVKRAIDTDKKFFDKTYEEQMAVMLDYAKEKIKSISKADQITIQPAPAPVPDPNAPPTPNPVLN